MEKATEARIQNIVASEPISARVSLYLSIHGRGIRLDMISSDR